MFFPVRHESSSSFKASSLSRVTSSSLDPRKHWYVLTKEVCLLVTMDTVLCIKLLVFLFTRCSWVSFEICGNPLFRLFFQMQLFFTRTGNGVLYLTAQPPLNKLQKAYSYININLVRLPVPRKEKKKNHGFVELSA